MADKSLIRQAAQRELKRHCDLRTFPQLVQASMQSVADGCMLQWSIHTLSAAPAWATSCATNIIPRTEYDATVFGDLTGSRGVVGRTQVKENTNVPTSSTAMQRPRRL